MAKYQRVTIVDDTQTIDLPIAELQLGMACSMSPTPAGFNRICLPIVCIYVYMYACLELTLFIFCGNIKNHEPEIQKAKIHLQNNQFGDALILLQIMGSEKCDKIEASINFDFIPTLLSLNLGVFTDKAMHSCCTCASVMNSSEPRSRK